jgi:cytochrome c553
VDRPRGGRSLSGRGIPALRTVRRLAVAFAGAAALLATSFASGDASAQNVAHGHRFAEELGCVNCHGPAGISSDPKIPNLAGQKYKYLGKQLTSFRLGKALVIEGEAVRERTHPAMSEMAAKLTNAAIRDLAAYYSALACAAPERAMPTEIPKEAARCETCHGGRRSSPFRDEPILNSQKEAYLIGEMEKFQRGAAELSKPTRTPGGKRADLRYHRLMAEFMEGDPAKLAAYFSALACH